MSEEEGRIDARTGLAEMTEDECWALLGAHTFGRLAVVVGSVPDIFPVDYRVHEGEIVVRTEAGTKLAAATLMAEVAFEIDESDPVHEQGWSVVVHGHGREPGGMQELIALEALGMQPWVDASKSRWLAITPTAVTGRRIR